MKRFFTSVALLSASSFLSRLLGILRDRLLASHFGASVGAGLYDLDTYYAAFRLPDFLFTLLISGTMASAFVPIFTNYIHKGEKNLAFAFANAVINFLFIILLGVSLLAFLTAPWLVGLITPGFSGEKLQITIQLSRLMLVTPILFGLSSIAQSMQNTFKTFFFYSLAPLIYNLSIIAGIIFLSDKWGVYGVAIGVIIGALLHLLIQLPTIYAHGFRYQWYFDRKREDLRKMIRLVIPRIFGASAGQLVLLIDTMIASTLAVGSITILNYAINLQSLPLGMVGVSIAVASFATLSELAGQNDQALFVKEIKNNLRLILYIIIPASFGLFLLRFEIVQLILRTGKFTSSDSVMTAQALGIFAFGLIAQSLIPLLARAFYALHNTKIPVTVGFVAVAVNIVVSLFFGKWLQWGVPGLSLGAVMASLVNVGLLYFYLGKITGSFKSLLPGREVIQFFSASIVMTIVILLIKILYVYYFGLPEGFWMYLSYVSIQTCCGALVYFGITKKGMRNV